MVTTSKSFDRIERQALKYEYVEGTKRILGEQPIGHRYKKVIDILPKMIEEGKLKNAFRDSDLSDLAIVTVHNYDEKSLFEQSLDFLGVEDYTVLKHSGEWSMAYKFTHLLEFIEGCEKPYILFCDARDTIFMDDPAKVVPFFKEFDCEVVFNATMSARGIYKSYESALPLYWWTRRISRTGTLKKYPNSGVFVGEKKIIKEISEIVVFYCEYMGWSEPYPSTLDQDVVRAIFPWFWPRMKLDYYNKIVYRN